MDELKNFDVEVIYFPNSVVIFIFDLFIFVLLKANFK